jgi:hypothetical protein
MARAVAIIMYMQLDRQLLQLLVARSTAPSWRAAASVPRPRKYIRIVQPYPGAVEGQKDSLFKVNPRGTRPHHCPFAIAGTFKACFKGVLHQIPETFTK